MAKISKLNNCADDFTMNFVKYQKSIDKSEHIDYVNLKELQGVFYKKYHFLLYQKF